MNMVKREEGTQSRLLRLHTDFSELPSEPTTGNPSLRKFRASVLMIISRSEDDLKEAVQRTMSRVNHDTERCGAPVFFQDLFYTAQS
jgi:hypothetical protein